MGSNAPCKRCLVIPGPGHEKCYVPHPEYHLEQHESCISMSLISMGECEAKYFCKACDSEITRQWNRKQGLGTAKIVGGKMWCFKGTHNTEHLVERDLRRIRNDVVVLDTGVNVEKTSAKLQEAIDSLNNTGNAIVKISDGFNDSVKSIRFNISMVQLVDLQLMDVEFSEIILDQTRTPNLQELFLHNVPDDCRMEILLPTLKKFKIFYYQGPDSWINPMLECAKQLETFETYKLQGAQGCLKFASNFLTKINLHRAECLDSLVVYAPRLEKLSLQACYSMGGRLTFKKTYPGLSEEMPENHEPPVCEVTITNAIVSPAIMRTLKNNPKCRIVNEDSQGPLGSEQFFNLFHRMM